MSDIVLDEVDPVVADSGATEIQLPGHLLFNHLRQVSVARLFKGNKKVPGINIRVIVA